jgi:hypothetical protein
MKKAIIAFAAIALMASCTDNDRVKNWGGTANLTIPANEKFVNVTWKETELWIVTRDRTAADTTYDTYRFQEKSSYGMMEGTYIIKEVRK